jgi:hypothetical protein
MRTIGGSSDITPETLWWKCNNGSGTTVTADVGPNGTTNGTWVTGLGGSDYAINYSGSSQSTTSNSTIAAGVNIVTVTFWVNLDDIISTRGVFSFGFQTANSINCYLNGNLRCELWGDTGHRDEIFTPPVISVTRFICIIYDGSTETGDIKVYYDAVEQTELSVAINTKTGTSNFATNTFEFANTSGAGFYLDGRGDDIRMYNRALSGSEITTLYSGGVK